MKKLIAIFLVTCSLPLTSIAQQQVDTTKFYIAHVVDQMTDKNYFIDMKAAIHNGLVVDKGFLE